MTLADLEAENRLLREFYDSWVFFHKSRSLSDAGETWDKTRQRMAAEALAKAADKVQAHIGRIRAH